MSFLIQIPIGMVFFVLSFYPIWLLWFERSRADDGAADNRVEVVKMILFEHQIIEQIREMRNQLQSPGFNDIPTISFYRGQLWDLLRLKNRQAALDALRRLSWVKGVRP